MRNWTKITKREDYAAQEGAREKLAKNRRHKKWVRAVSVLASVMVFVTTYSMILPTLTATRTDLPDDTDANEVRWTRETPAWKGELLALHIDEAEQAARLAVVVDPRPEEETPVVTAAISTQEIDVDALAAAGVLVLQDDADVNAHANTNTNVNANASAAEALPLAISPAAEKTATADAAGAEAPAAEAARGADAMAEAAAEAAILNGPAALVELPMDSEAIEVLNPALAPVYPTLSEDVEALLRDVKSAGILEAQDFAALVAETNRTLEIIETPQAPEEADAAADADGAEGEADAVEEETAAADDQDAADVALDADTVEGDADAAAGEEDDAAMAIADDQDDDADAVTDAETPAEADSAIADAESEDAAEAAGEDPASEEAVAGDAEDAETAAPLTIAEAMEQATAEIREADGVLTASGEDYLITVTYGSDAEIPAAAALTVTEIRPEDEEYAEYYAQSLATLDATDERKIEDAETVSEGLQNAVEALAEKIEIIDIESTDSEETIAKTSADYARIFDIEIWDGDQKIEPAASVAVNIKLLDAPVAEEATPQVVHFAETGAEKIDLTEATATQNTDSIQFETDAFSVYSVVYTVDFHWEVDGETYDFSLPGGGFVSFTDLVQALGIADDAKKFTADVADVQFSNPELVWVGKIEENTTVGAIKDGFGLACEYSAELTEEQIAEINAQTVEAGDWALIALKAFDSEESLTVTMKTGEVFVIKVTDAQASDPYGLDKQTFVFANSNKAMQSSLNSGSLGSGNVSGATTEQYRWTVEFDKNAFDGKGGYYIKNTNNKYLKVDNGQISFTDKDTIVTVEEGGESVEKTIVLATPLSVKFDETKSAGNTSINSGKERGAYQFSTDINSGSGFLTYSNNRFTIANTNNDNTWMMLRSPAAPTSDPGTVGTWDIVSDEIVLKLFDYTGTITSTEDDWDNGKWEDWDQSRWYIDYNKGNWYGTIYRYGYPETGNWVTGEYKPGTKTVSKDIDAVWGSNTNESTLRSGEGINAGRTILFSGSGMSNQAGYNNFTGSNTDGSGGYYSGYVYQNMVKHNLGTDGFPVLGVTIPSNAAKDIAESGSLGYLFGSSSKYTDAQNGVTPYTNGGAGLQGLLRKDDKGYYYYDSEDNYARLNGDEILLYSDTYNKNAGSSNVKKEKIGFFPFNNMNTSDGEEKGPAKVDAGGELYYDHQFGLSLETQFVYPNGGVVPDTGEQMKFEFSGDDDVWVFVDGVLVLDLGGVHQPIKGTINFATGDVDIYEYNSSGREYKSDKSTTIAKMFAAASNESGETKTFDTSDFSSHKLSFFYLERGGCDSNMAIKFNLLVNKSLTVAKKLNGLTPTERQKYMNDVFLYELALRHDAKWNDSDVDIDINDESAIWENASKWRNGFITYSTPFDYQNEEGNYTQYNKQDGTIEKGKEINNGQIYLKANESMTISRLPRTDIFYLAEENQLDMAQFETPHAERLFIDASDSKQHEEEVHLHKDTAMSDSKPDWETKPYALMDTEKVVYTNTLLEQNIDVWKEWQDNDASDRPGEVEFKLVATVNGKPYADETGHDSINAQWTETKNKVADTKTGNVLTGKEDGSTSSESEEYPYKLNAANGWHMSFEHLPKKTESPTGEGKDIVYSIVEKAVDGYTTSDNGLVDTDEVYLDLFKFWPDDNSNHAGDKKEDINVKIQTKMGDTIYYVVAYDQLKNGEYKFKDFTTDIDQATDFPLVTKDSYGTINNLQDMFDYSTRVIAPKSYKMGEGEEAVTYTPEYELVEPVDKDDSTKGTVLFTRPKQEWRILNSKGTTEITVKKTDSTKSGDQRFIAGAKFSLYKTGSTDELITAPVIKNAGTSATISLDNESKFEIPVEGITISDLQDGSYKLVELEAPDGYVITNNTTTFTVSGGKVTAWNLTGTAGNTLEIPNTPGVELPSTGGPGTVPFTAAGALLITAAGIFVIRRKRRGARIH